MQTSTPLTAQQARKIAFHRGLLFGAGAGILILLMLLFPRLFAASRFTFYLIFLIALLAFFWTGRQTTLKTHRIDMGARAGFWAGLVVTLFVFASALISLIGPISPDTSRGAILSSIIAVFPFFLLPLIVGPIVGMLGGVLSRSDEDVVPPLSPSVQPPSPPVPLVPSPPSTGQSTVTAPVQPIQPPPPSQP